MLWLIKCEVAFFSSSVHTGTEYPLLLTGNHSLCSMSGTKVRVESSSVQIVLPIPTLRNKKNNGEQFRCIYETINCLSHFFHFFYVHSYTICKVSLKVLKTENKTANFGNGNITDELLQTAIITSQITGFSIFADIPTMLFCLVGPLYELPV